MEMLNQEMMLPEGSVALNLEEMREVEGGYYVSNKKIQSIIQQLGFASMATVATLGPAAVASAISGASYVITSLLLAIPGGVAIAGTVGAWVTAHAVEIAGELIEACVYQKGLDITFEMEGIYPHIDFSARKK